MSVSRPRIRWSVSCVAKKEGGIDRYAENRKVIADTTCVGFGGIRSRGGFIRQWPDFDIHGEAFGNVTDPQGAAVPDAKVTIAGVDAGINRAVATNSSGYFSAGALAPSSCNIKIEAANFKTSSTKATVQVCPITSANVKLELGSSRTTVEVTEENLGVYSEQAAAQDVLTAADIE